MIVSGLGVTFCTIQLFVGKHGRREHTTSSARSELAQAIEQVRDGNVDAFEVIVRRWEWPLQELVDAMPLVSVDVDEVAQRTFIQAFRHIERFQSGTDFRAWLWAIGRAQLMGEATQATAN